MLNLQNIHIGLKSALALSLCAAFVSPAQAGLVFVNESDGTHDQAFYIDSGDASTDFIDLEFGNTIDAKLRYEVSNNQFTLNRDLDMGGLEIQDVSLEKLAAAPTCDGTATGRIYYNTTDDNSYICNGTAFEQIDGGAGGHTQNTDTGTDSDTFTLDSDDSSVTTVNLDFTTGGAQVSYDTVGDDFSINRDLDISGNEVQNIKFETLATAPATCDAAQLGRVYFNTTDDVLYSCDGASWNQLENTLSATVEFPVVEAHRTTTYTLTTTYTDITFDVTDLENDPTTLEHDNTNTDRINIGATAMYLITYAYTAGGTAVATHEARARVRANDTTVVSGSASVNKNFNGEFSTTSASFLANLNDGDFISLQLQRDAIADATQDEIYFSAVKLEGVKGDAGADGADGADGVNGGDTDANTFIIDNDDTGGDVTVQFGATLSESLTWDDTNNRFNLSDTLRVAGNLEQDGTAMTLDADNVGAGANVDIVAEQGTDNNGTLRYNATGNEWELSNDSGTFEAISTFEPSVFYAYDGSTGQTIGTGEATMNIDTPVITDANYSLAADTVTVTDAGLYRITFQLGLDGANTSGGNRTSVIMQLQEAGVDIAGAVTKCYLRESEENACSLTVLENVAAGAAIRARVQRQGSTAVAIALDDASRLIIEKIR